MKAQLAPDCIQPAPPETFTAATIGFFDGVHQGHVHLIRQMQVLAKEEGLKTLVVTFDNSPRAVLHPDEPFFPLTTPKEKTALLLQTGIDYCCTLHFTKEMAALTAQEFMQTYLYDALGVRLLVVGYDNRFGKGSNEGFDDYVRQGEAIGLRVARAGAWEGGDMQASSTVLRRLLQEGDVRQAAQLLGRPYGFEGTVVHGRRVGHELGFPTANFSPTSLGKMLPMDGSYAVRVKRNGEVFPAMLYVGTRPTFLDVSEQVVEVSLLEFSGDLYGETLQVDFIDRLRGEVRFESPAQLARQLQDDARRTREILQHTPCGK